MVQLLSVADDNSGKEEFNEVSWSLDHTPQARTYLSSIEFDYNSVSISIFMYIMCVSCPSHIPN